MSNHTPVSRKSLNVMKPSVGSSSFFVATTKKKSATHQIAELLVHLSFMKIRLTFNPSASSADELYIKFSPTSVPARSEIQIIDRFKISFEAYGGISYQRVLARCPQA